MPCPVETEIKILLVVVCTAIRDAVKLPVRSSPLEVQHTGGQTRKVRSFGFIRSSAIKTNNGHGTIPTRIVVELADDRALLVLRNISNNSLVNAAILNYVAGEHRINAPPFAGLGYDRTRVGRTRVRAHRRYRPVANKICHRKFPFP